MMPIGNISSQNFWAKIRSKDMSSICTMGCVIFQEFLSQAKIQSNCKQIQLDEKILKKCKKIFHP